MTQVTVCALILLVLQSATADQSTECVNIPNGLQQIGRGINVATLDIFPLNKFRLNGFKRRVFDFTCATSRTWTFNGQEWDIPDQVSTIEANQKSNLMNMDYTQFDNTLDLVRRQASDLLGFGSCANMSQCIGWFAETNSALIPEKSASGKDEFATKISGSLDVYDAAFGPSMNHYLSRPFLAFYNRLPTLFTQNPAMYTQFIMKYGTHYFSNASFGGQVEVDTILETSLRKTLTSTEIYRSSSSSFMGMFKSSNVFADRTIQTNEEFDRRSRKTLKYYGGMMNLLQPEELQLWVRSVPINPWLLGGQLRPLTELLPVGQKRTSLEQGIRTFLDKAHLKDLIGRVRQCINVGQCGSEEHITAALALIAQPAPDHNSVLELVGKINSLLGIKLDNVSQRIRSVEILNSK